MDIENMRFFCCQVYYVLDLVLRLSTFLCVSSASFSDIQWMPSSSEHLLVAYVFSTKFLWAGLNYAQKNIVFMHCYVLSFEKIEKHIALDLSLRPSYISFGIVHAPWAPYRAGEWHYYNLSKYILQYIDIILQYIDI